MGQSGGEKGREAGAGGKRQRRGVWRETGRWPKRGGEKRRRRGWGEIGGELGVAEGTRKETKIEKGSCIGETGKSGKGMLGEVWTPPTNLALNAERVGNERV